MGGFHDHRLARLGHRGGADRCRGILVATAINVAAGLKPGVLFGFVFVATSALAALSIWAIAHHIESEPGRVFIEQATGRQVVFKRSAGSLFFIPTRYWSYIVVGAGVPRRRRLGASELGQAGTARRPVR